MSTWSAVLLGVVQGITEFLPVSSSAHLILARTAFGWDAGPFALAFDVACHVGTLLAVVTYFRRELFDLGQRTVGVCRGADLRSASPVWLLMVGTVPVAVAGVLFGDAIEGSLRTPVVAAGALAVGAVAFLGVERRQPGTRDEPSLTAVESLLIGVGQACALVPGVSRSGATITVGLLIGLRREAAARFGFLLGVPAIVAATVREMFALREAVITGDLVWLFLIGAVTSAVVGYLSVKYFLRYLVGHTLSPFAMYRFALAAAVLLS